MNTISAATHPTTRGSGLTSKAGINATGLPDFALLLGMTLSLNELEQKMSGGTTAAMGTAQAAMAVDGKTALASGPINIVASEPGKENPATENAAPESDTVAAIVGAQAMQAAMTGSQPTPAGKEISAMTAAAQRTAPTLAMAQAAKAQSAKAPKVAATPSTAAESKTWQVGELAHQIRSALGSVAQQSNTPASATATATATAPPAMAAAFLNRAEGDKIRSAGMDKLLKHSMNGKKTEPALAITPAAPQPGASIKALAEQFLGGANANAKTQPMTQQSLTAATLAQTQADDAATGTTDAEAPATSLAGNTPSPLTWAPQPAVTATQETRMPSMIEQVRQVADFLAERTEGVVKMGKDGVEANLKLYPPDLGGVRVQLNVMNDRTTQAQFIVERPETAQLLQQHMRSFQQGLESHGLTVDRVQITVQQTVKPGSGGAESGWRQNGAQDFRREASENRERQGQTPRRNGRGGGGQNFGEA